MPRVRINPRASRCLGTLAGTTTWFSTGYGTIRGGSGTQQKNETKPGKSEERNQTREIWRTGPNSGGGGEYWLPLVSHRFWVAPEQPPPLPSTPATSVWSGGERVNIGSSRTVYYLCTLDQIYSVTTEPCLNIDEYIIWLYCTVPIGYLEVHSHWWGPQVLTMLYWVSWLHTYSRPHIHLLYTCYTVSTSTA